MNSNSIQYGKTENSKFEKFASIQISILTNAIRKVSAIFTHSDLEISQARYKMKRLHTEKVELHQATIGALPIEEKLKLGMYHFMD